MEPPDGAERAAVRAAPRSRPAQGLETDNGALVLCHEVARRQQEAIQIGDGARGPVTLPPAFSTKPGTPPNRCSTSAAASSGTVASASPTAIR
jgi:hypothetical protein